MKMIAIAALAVMFGMAGAAPARNDTKIGAGVTLKEATPIADVVKSPKDFVGKTIRVDGVATAVCEAMGCWMAVAASDDKDAPTVRLQVEDGGPVVFPISAKGKRVSAEGVFQAVAGSDEHGKDAAAEHAKKDEKASDQYHIKATGALIK
jgi:hypothetical protein